MTGMIAGVSLKDGQDVGVAVLWLAAQLSMTGNCR